MSETLLSLFAEQVARSPRRTALRFRSGGLWRARTWDDWRTTSREVAAGLLSLGIVAGDRVALLSHTRTSWVETDLAILKAGAATVPLYPTLLPDTIGEILRDSGARIVFAEDPVQLAKVLSQAAGPLPALESAVVFDPVSRLLRPDESGRLDVSVEDVAGTSRVPVISSATLRERGRAYLAENPLELARRAAALSPASLAAVYYTSGTSGEPKGVVLTHDNFVSEADALHAAMPVGPGDEQLLFLPLAHIVAKLTVMMQLRVGYVTSFAESIEQAADDCREVRPTFLVGVPRVFEKMQEAVLSMSTERGVVEQRVLSWALDVGRRVSALRQAGREPEGALALQHRTAERLVYGRVKQRLGGRIRFMMSGAAPLARETAEFFHSMDLLILEGYGLTESTGASTLNVPERYRFGTVGTPVRGVELRLDDDGEILLRGRSLSPGYWCASAPASLDREEAFTEDGFFRTGDVGSVDAQGFLTITDRKKDLVITAGGKNLAPQRIEQRLTRSPYVEHAVVVGDRRRYAVALLWLDLPAISSWAKRNGVTGDHAAQARHPSVRALIASQVEGANAGLASFESIKRFEILSGGYADLLTPTGKVKRRLVTDRYADRIEALYEDVAPELADLS